MADGPGDSPDDGALMLAHVRGEAGAFDALFRRRAPELLRVVRRYVDDEELARDIVQQSFVQLHTARHDFRPGARLKPWLNTIALNLARQHHRRRKVRKERPLSDGEDVPTEDVPLPLEQAQRTQRLRRALSRLPERQREVVLLHWFEEKSFAEVARSVGASEGAVRVRAHRAYTRLRKLLDETE